MSNIQPLWRDIRFVRGAAGGAVLASVAVGVVTVGFFPRAHAAETAVTAPGSAFAEQILGKAGPAESLSPDTIPADFRLLRLVDTGSRVGFYVTHGDTLSAGGQTFLLAYQVALYTDADGVQKIARGQDMSLALVNMSSVEIIDQMGPVPEVGTPPPPRSQQ